LKRVVLFLSLLCVGTAFAAGDKISTSKSYVDTQIATKQEKIPAVNTNTVLTHTNTDGEIGEKAIYDATANYATQTDALVTAADANAAIQNAIDTEFVCTEWAPNAAHTDDNCYIWNVQNSFVQQILPDGYTALEYLEGAISGDTGTKIATNIPWTSIYHFRGKAQQKAISGINGAVLGSSTQRVNSVNCFWGTRGGDNRNYWYWDTNILPTTIVNFDIRRIDSTQWQGTVNGVLTHSWENTTFTDNVVIMNDAQTEMNRTFNGNVWNIQLFGSNDNLIFSGIPARRNSDDEIGMYDLVSNTFFTNSGSGSFIAGPDLNTYLPSGQ
jgi:hypothetical protein